MNSSNFNQSIRYLLNSTWDSLGLSHWGLWPLVPSQLVLWWLTLCGLQSTSGFPVAVGMTDRVLQAESVQLGVQGSYWLMGSLTFGQWERGEIEKIHFYLSPEGTTLWCGRAYGLSEGSSTRWLSAVWQQAGPANSCMFLFSPLPHFFLLCSFLLPWEASPVKC